MTASRRALLLFSTTCLALLGCDRHDHPAEAPAAADEWPARAVTVWTDRFEYFFEHDVPVPGRECGFALHVSNLADGSPRTAGELLLTLRSGEQVIEVPLAAPARPGIYLTDVVFPAAGVWEWSVEVDGDRPALPAIEVFAGEDAAHAFGATLEDPPGGVTMLKEQQWPVRLKIAVAAPHTLEERVPATARIVAAPTHAAWVPAPAAGTLLPPPDAALASAGDTVEADQLLAVFRIPMLGGDLAGWESASLQREAAVVEAAQGRTKASAALVGAHAERSRAKSEFVRVEKLHATQAKSDRELEEARYQLAAAIAAEDAASGALQTWSEAAARLASADDAFRGPAASHFDLELRAPVAGQVVAAPQASGAWLDAGAPVFHILDESRLRVAVRVAEAELAGIGAQPRVRVIGPGTDESIELPGPNGALLVARPPIDSRTRSGEILFEVTNPGWMRVGMTLEATLGAGAARTALAIPATALVDDHGVTVVYVQSGGETFDRRTVRTGIRDGGMVEVFEGVSAGEQVVVDGAYVVRLVSLSGAIPEHSH